MLRGFFLIFLLIGVAMVAFLGFRGRRTAEPPVEVFPDMVRQMKVRAQAPLSFFADNRGPRVPVPGTIPIGYDMPKPDQAPDTDPTGQMAMRPQIGFSVGSDYYNTGRMGLNWGTGIPMDVTPQLMQRGEQRFNINCAVCHGVIGDGNGIAKQFGLTTVQSLQQDRIRTMSDGEIFNTITHGKNTMMSYGGNITVPDRWAIIAYLRALQRSQNAAVGDVPPEHRAALEQPAAAASPAPPPEGAKP